jgi:hypothetical protein
LAELLEGTIRGRKAAEFVVWAGALEAMQAAAPGTKRAVALQADRELKSLRQYRPPAGCLRRPPIARVLQFDILSALAAFAAEHQGPLSATGYARMRTERHREWPARNTVAAHFGGWHAALDAAGLAQRAARSADRYANRSRGTLDARLVQQRERGGERQALCAGGRADAARDGVLPLAHRQRPRHTHSGDGLQPVPWRLAGRPGRASAARARARC